MHKKSLDIREDDIVALTYIRCRESGIFQVDAIEQKEVLCKALRTLSFGKESNIVTEDCTDILRIAYKDGSSQKIEIENDHIVIEGNRYQITNGLKEIRGLLNHLYKAKEE